VIKTRADITKQKDKSKSEHIGLYKEQGEERKKKGALHGLRAFRLEEIPQVVR